MFPNHRFQRNRVELIQFHMAELYCGFLQCRLHLQIKKQLNEIFFRNNDLELHLILKFFFKEKT